MDLDLALVLFHRGDAATEAFVAARDRAAPAGAGRTGAAAPWTRQVGLVEHHHNGHLVLRGTFAGHYVDVDEALHLSETGAGEGFVGGAALGVFGGPPGLAFGSVVGAVLGSQVGAPTESDAEPQPLVEQLRAAVPRSRSAIVMIAEPRDVDEMLAAIGDSGGEVIRQSLTAAQAAAIQASLSASPPASRGPSIEGEEAVEASERGPEGA
jgi:uncharacterized membrane protein